MDRAAYGRRFECGKLGRVEYVRFNVQIGYFQVTARDRGIDSPVKIAFATQGASFPDNQCEPIRPSHALFWPNGKRYQRTLGHSRATTDHGAASPEFQNLDS